MTTSMVSQLASGMIALALAKFVLNDVPHAVGLMTSEEEQALIDQYGKWAVQMGKRFCPTGDIECVRQEANRFYTNMRAGRKVI